MGSSIQRRMEVIPIPKWIAYFLADKGYDTEKVHEACTKKCRIDIIKRKERKSKMATYRSLTDKFFNSNPHKEIRGVIETIFGGLENKGLLKTRIRTPKTIFKYTLATAINHNQRTSITAKILKLPTYLFETLRCIPALQRAKTQMSRKFALTGAPGRIITDSALLSFRLR